MDPRNDLEYYVLQAAFMMDEGARIKYMDRENVPMVEVTKDTITLKFPSGKILRLKADHEGW